MSKLAVIFPGIGYGKDKPLLYYAARMARREFGYDVVSVEYSRMPRGIKEDPARMREAVEQALSDAGDCLSGVDVGAYDGLLFISKSLGTIVAAITAQNLPVACEHIFFTPMLEAFDFAADASGIAFHGTEDPWTDTEELIERCEEKDIPLYLFEDADHSLEVGDVEEDLRILKRVIKKTRKKIRKGADDE
ncbi:MAG: alpha/beta hydrolase [Eubacterium sp.]|nr:alpha/beta hydrolase [Eubacterium sp.]